MGQNVGLVQMGKTNFFENACGIPLVSCNNYYFGLLAHETEDIAQIVSNPLYQCILACCQINNRKISR